MSDSSVLKPGKVQGSSMPQEYNLMRLIQNIENPRPSWNTSTPACEWEDVSCDQSSMVTEINWEVLHLRGLLCLEYLPDSIIDFHASENALFGSVRLDYLPGPLELLNLSENAFSGAVDLVSLPSALRSLYLDENMFTGSVVLNSLPSQLRILNLAANKLTGTLDLGHLPPNLETLYLSNNCFEGEVLLNSLPQSLRFLWMRNNTLLQGEIGKKNLSGKLLIKTDGTLISILPE